MLVMHMCQWRLQSINVRLLGHAMDDPSGPKQIAPRPDLTLRYHHHLHSLPHHHSTKVGQPGSIRIKPLASTRTRRVCILINMEQKES